MVAAIMSIRFRMDEQRCKISNMLHFYDIPGPTSYSHGNMQKFFNEVAGCLSVIPEKVVKIV